MASRISCDTAKFSRAVASPTEAICNERSNSMSSNSMILVDFSIIGNHAEEDTHLHIHNIQETRGYRCEPAHTRRCRPLTRRTGDPRPMRCERSPADIPSELALAATYYREVRAGIERIWENVLDWEHLPALHEIYFDHVALIEIGSWGWRVELTKAGTAGRRMLLELQIDRAKARYRVRTLAGEGTGTEIWTLLEALAPHLTAIEVRFYLPEHRPERLAALGEKYRSSYARLWDQDEAMMMRREALSARPPVRSEGSGASLALGPLAELRARLPLLVELEGEPFR